MIPKFVVNKFSVKIRILFILILQFTFPAQVKADMFGGDVVVLSQILANAVQQLTQLRQVVGAGRDSLRLINDINRGINDVLRLANTISSYRDPGVYKDWTQIQNALRDLKELYGTVIESKDSDLQKNTDQSVAEAVTLNNKIYEYSKQIDEIGRAINEQSGAASPKGAQKLTAQSMGVLLNIQSQSLRAQATGLKLQAQSLALQNRKEKERTKQMLNVADSFERSMNNHRPQFTLPRF